MSSKKSHIREFILIEFAERLKTAIKHKFGSLNKFADEAEVSQPWVSNYTSGKREPGASSLFVFGIHGLDIHHLLTGEHALNPEILEKLELLDKRIEKLEASNYRLSEENKELKEDIEMKDQEIKVLRVRHAEIDKATKDKLMGKAK